jgi:hypothetical protein
MAGLIDPDFIRLTEPAASLFRTASEWGFFNHPCWYDALSRSVVAPGSQVRLYIAEAADARLGLVARTEAAAPRRLRTLTNYYSCEHALLAGGPPGDPTAGITELVRQIAGERPRWRTIALSTLDPADASYAVLARALRAAAFAVQPYFEFGTWYEDTVGLSFSDYLVKRPSVVLATWRRKLKKREAAGLEFRLYSDLADVESGIADYQTVYRASWKEPEPYPRFIPDLIMACASIGALRLGIFHLDGRPVAAQLWILWRGRATLFKLAHDRRHDDLSPGTLLSMRMIEHVLDVDKPREINLGRGDDPYKRLWATKRRERWGLMAGNLRTLHGLGLGIEQAASRVLRRSRQDLTVPAGL